EGIKSICEAICDKRHNKIKYVDFSGNELSAETAEFVIRRWREVFDPKYRRVELKMTNNCYGSNFAKLKMLISYTGIDLGLSDDDEGSMSDYSEKLSESEENVEDSEEEGDRSARIAGGDDKDVDGLLQGVGCMKFTDQLSMSESSSNDVVSFLDQQLKLNTIQDAESVAKCIEQQKCMRVLELKGNTLGIESGKRIAQAIKCHPELKRCLWSDMFTGRLKDEIPPILKSLCSAMISADCHITELDLSDNAFGPIGAEGR
ncbi:hypothetical protein NECAME_08935, partial [Necator americanus]